MKSLVQFCGSTQVFQNADKLPAFFQSNLLHPSRVVKVFANDPQAHLRIFYYQYLKLCFEIEEVNYNFYLGKIQQIINSQFRFIFPQQDDPAIFNDVQAKNFIIQFFGLLGEGRFSVQTALNSYPIMDHILTYFFRSIFLYMKKTESLDSYMPRDQILGFLCSYFGVALQIHEKCVKYVETDIFVYQQSPQQIYMAYMEYQPSQTQSTPKSNSTPRLRSSASQRASNFQGFPIKPNYGLPFSAISNSLQKNGYIVSQFNDFTGSNANHKASISPQSQVIRSPHLLNGSRSQNSPFTSHEPKNKLLKNNSIISPAPFSLKQPKGQIFYHPTQDNGSYRPVLINKAKIQSPTGTNKMTNNSSGNTIQKKPFGLNVSEQFTNSWTMKSMVEPYRTNVTKLRVRARSFRNSLLNLIK